MTSRHWQQPYLLVVVLVLINTFVLVLLLVLELPSFSSITVTMCNKPFSSLRVYMYMAVYVYIKEGRRCALFRLSIMIAL